jgi:hypothetical protein
MPAASAATAPPRCRRTVRSPKTLHALSAEIDGPEPRRVARADWRAANLVTTGERRTSTADMLDAPTGRYSRHAVIMHMRHRIDAGDIPDLAGPRQVLAEQLRCSTARER